MKLLLLLALGQVLGAAAPGGWCAAKIQALNYPALGLQARISGVVRLELHISANGSVSGTRILAGNQVLAQAAEQNVKGWKFMRCTLRETETAVPGDDVVFSYDFRLVGEAQSAPKTEFVYEHPNRVTVTSAALHWMP